MNTYPANPPNIDLTIKKPVAEQLARDIATETNARIAADNVLRADIDEIVLSGHNSLTGRDADNCHPQSAITSLVSDLASKAPIANPTFTGTVSGVTKAMVGLSDVDNTSDASKPVSTATQTALNLKANLASPALTGTPTTPTASAGTNTTQIASTAFVRAECAAIVDAAPSTLDTLNELAAALGDDPNFATTMTNALADKAPLASPSLTGTPTAPTATTATDTTQLATTEFVHNVVEAIGLDNIPTADQKAALAGTDGTPSASNPYVTTEDGRLPVAPGDAPVYGCRAWVNFDGTTADNITATYAISGTVCTVTKAAHGHIVGHRVYLDFTSGTGADGLYTITGVTTDTYTVTHASATTSGNVTELRRKINASGNVHTVAYENAVGKYHVNFLIAAPSTFYNYTGMVKKDDTYDDPNLGMICGGRAAVYTTASSIPVRTGRNTSPELIASTENCVSCFW